MARPGRPSLARPDVALSRRAIPQVKMAFGWKLKRGRIRRHRRRRRTAGSVLAARRSEDPAPTSCCWRRETPSAARDAVPPRCRSYSVRPPSGRSIRRCAGARAGAGRSGSRGVALSGTSAPDLTVRGDCLGDRLIISRGRAPAPIRRHGQPADAVAAQVIVCAGHRHPAAADADERERHPGDPSHRRHPGPGAAREALAAVRVLVGHQRERVQPGAWRGGGGDRAQLLVGADRDRGRHRGRGAAHRVARHPGTGPRGGRRRSSRAASSGSTGPPSCSRACCC